MESGKWRGKNVQANFDARREKVHFARFMRNDNLLRCGRNFRGDSRQIADTRVWYPRNSKS